MQPLPPLPAARGSEHYIVFDGSDAVLSVPARDFRLQALLVIFLLPVAWGAIGLLVALGGAEADAAALGGGLFCLFTALTTPLGLVQLALASRRARKTRLRVGADRSLVLANGRRLGPGELRSLRLGQQSPLLKWMGILGRTDKGELLLLGRLPPSRRDAVGAVTLWLGEALGVPAEVAPATLGMSPEKAAGFCYFPIQGIWLIFSLLALVASKDARVRFAAKQSLVYYSLSGILLVACLLPLIPVVALLPEDVGPAIGGLGLFFLVIPLGFLRLGLGLLASWRAFQGRSWVIPGLGWITRRWLPPG